MTQDPIISYTNANSLILAAILLVMLGIYGYAKSFGTPKAVLYEEHKSTASAFWFFFAYAFFSFLLYVWLHLYLRIGRPIESYDLQIGMKIIGNAAGFCILAAALAYARGTDFNYVRAMSVILMMSFVVTIWTFGWQVAGRTDNAFATSLELAPEVVLPSVAIVSLGWVFFIRWGGVAGGLYLLITIVYAFLQLPANLRVGFEKYMAAGRAAELDIAFSFLAGGKLLLAFGFISLLCSSTLRSVYIDKPKYWPTRPINPPRWIQQMGGWVASLIGSIVVALVTLPKCSILKLFSMSCS